MNDDRTPTSGTDPASEPEHRDYIPSAEPTPSEDVARMLVASFEPVDPDPSVWDRISADISSSGQTSPDSGVAEVVDLSERRRLWPALFSVAAVFLAILGTVVVLNATSDDAAVVAADSTYELLDPTTGELAMTVLADDDGAATAVSVALDALDAGQTYQLWSVVGDEIVSVGLLGPEPGDVPLRIEGDPSVLALTVEVTGGVAVSEATPVAVWQASS